MFYIKKMESSGIPAYGKKNPYPCEKSLETRTPCCRQNPCEVKGWQPLHKNVMGVALFFIWVYLFFLFLSSTCEKFAKTFKMVLKITT